MEEVKEASGHAPVVSPPLPADVLKLIFRDFSINLLVRHILASKSNGKNVLAATTSLLLRPPNSAISMNQLTSWTHHLSPEAPLSSLTHLSVYQAVSSETLGRILRFAPLLESLEFRQPTDIPVGDRFCHLDNSLCHHLSHHLCLRNVSIYDLATEECRIVPFLPLQLRSLQCFTRGELKVPFFQDIVSYCPNLSTLRIDTFKCTLDSVIASLRSSNWVAVGADIPYAAVNQLKKLPRLTELNIGRIETINTPDYANDYMEFLSYIPSPPAGRKWKQLIYGGADLQLAYFKFPQDLGLLRELYRRGVAPDLRCIAFTGLTDDAQLAFLRFVFEECQLRTAVCACILENESCQYCRWFSRLPNKLPQAASYLLEKQFLPLVAAKSKLYGYSPDAVASHYLQNFEHRNVHENTVLAYLQTLTYPLQLSGYRLPPFLRLHTQQQREALIARAAALEADIGLRRDAVVEEKDRTELTQEAVFHAASIEPAFLLRNLSYLATGVAWDRRIVELAKKCQLSPAERLSELTRTGLLFAYRQVNTDALFRVLKELLSVWALANLLDERVMNVPFDPATLSWALHHGYQFHLLRTPKGENWLHFQLLPLTQEASNFYGDLLTEPDAEGNTPLHAMCKRFKNNSDLNIHFAKMPEEAFLVLEAHGLWDLKNAAGATPLELLPFPRAEIKNLRVLSLIDKHLVKK